VFLLTHHVHCLCNSIDVCRIGVIGCWHRAEIVILDIVINLRCIFVDISTVM
jgi:hypothetical protein